MNTITSRTWLIAGIVLSPLVSSGCVSQSKYDALWAQNERLQLEHQQLQARVARLQDAMAYTVIATCCSSREAGR